MIRRAAEAQLQRALRQHKRAVHQHVSLGKQRALFRVARKQLFIGIAAICPYVQPERVGGACQLCAGRTLTERFAAAERDAVQQRIAAQLFDDLLRIDFASALKIVRLRVVAARAVMRAALRKYRQPKAGAVYDGIVHDS